jgi:hypothetical protein
MNRRTLLRALIAVALAPLLCFTGQRNATPDRRQKFSLPLQATYSLPENCARPGDQLVIRADRDLVFDNTGLWRVERSLAPHSRLATFTCTWDPSP